MRLAFCLDGYHDQVGVELRQDERVVHAVMHGPGELDAIQRQVARVLSLDHDARGFVEVGQRDPVIGRLQRAAVGLRPPLFYSPYEAAVWSVLSARRPGWQMARVRAELSKAHGALFELAGERLAALPTPSQLLAVKGFPGIDADRLTRMHGAARAGRVVANVFVDAGLPVRNGHVPLAPPAFRDFLLQKTDAEGLLPGWTHWWDETDLEGLFPSAGVREQVEREQPPLPLSYFPESLPAPFGWDDRPCAYLAFGDTYSTERHEAKARGWPVTALPGQHLHTLVAPEQVAATIDALLRRLGIDPED
jgi:hypothetical protein